MRPFVALALSVTTAVAGGASGCAATSDGISEDLSDDNAYEPSDEYPSYVTEDLSAGPGIYFEDVPPLVYVEPNIYVVQDFAYPVYYAYDAYWYYGMGVWWCTRTWYDPWYPVNTGYVPWTLHERHHDHYRNYHGDRHARVHSEGELRRRPPEFYRDRDRQMVIGNRRVPQDMISERVQPAQPSEFRGRVTRRIGGETLPTGETRTVAPSRDVVSKSVAGPMEANDRVRARREAPASQARSGYVPRRSTTVISEPTHSPSRAYSPSRAVSRAPVSLPSSVRMSRPTQSAPRAYAPRSSSPGISASRSSAPRVSAPRASAPRASAPRVSAPRASMPSGGRSHGGGRR